VPYGGRGSEIPLHEAPLSAERVWAELGLGM
jgi:hypothetical protein